MSQTDRPVSDAANDQREDYNRSVWAERYATALGSDTDPSAGVGQSSVGSAAGPAAANRQEFYIYRCWTRLWWCARRPDSDVLDDWPDAVAWTRERLIAKLRRRANEPKPDPWERIYV